MKIETETQPKSPTLVADASVGQTFRLTVAALQRLEQESEDEISDTVDDVYLRYRSRTPLRGIPVLRLRDGELQEFPRQTHIELVECKLVVLQ